METKRPHCYSIEMKCNFATKRNQSAPWKQKFHFTQGEIVWSLNTILFLVSLTSTSEGRRRRDTEFLYRCEVDMRCEGQSYTTCLGYLLLSGAPFAPFAPLSFLQQQWWMEPQRASFKAFSKARERVTDLQWRTCPCFFEVDGLLLSVMMWEAGEEQR